MKVALVHDWLDRRIGGAERVLLELASMYPDAPVFTMLHDPVASGGRIAPERVRTSWLQSLPRFVRARPKYLLPIIPTAVEQFDLSGYDVVISSSLAFAKNVLTPPATLHVCYCHSPMRFVWDHWPAYLDEQDVGPVRALAIRLMVSRLRVWDRAGVSRVDTWIANSETTARRIRKYYGEIAPVVHPGVDVESWTPVPAEGRGDHYVTLATLTPYKRIDLAVDAFNASGRRLIVIGDGPDRGRLEERAGPTVTFAGHVDDRERARLLGTARALVFPGEEDFGIAPVEAMAAGTPVVAFGRGGATESVVDGITGAFFDTQTAADLNAAIDRIRRQPLRQSDLVDRAREFDVRHFRARLGHLVEGAYAAHVAAMGPSTGAAAGAGQADVETDHVS